MGVNILGGSSLAGVQKLLVVKTFGDHYHYGDNEFQGVIQFLGVKNFWVQILWGSKFVRGANIWGSLFLGGHSILGSLNFRGKNLKGNIFWVSKIV